MLAELGLYWGFSLVNRYSTLLIAFLVAGGSTGSFAATDVADQRLINTCAARTDARMESMTLRKLEQIRNYEFSLRMALAQQAAGADAMSPTDWQRVTSDVRLARARFAQVCELKLPMQG